jgi:membrane associated rhomboid family serine protease
LSVTPLRISPGWARARVTLAITIVTAAAWLVAWVLGREEWVAIWGGFIPARLAFGDQGLVFAPFWLTPLTSALIHAGPIHLGVNLLMLVFCGRPVEWRLGPWAVALLYLLGAYAAAGAQYLAGPSSPLPMVGASGAISTLLGAYAILEGRNKVKVKSRRLALWLNALWLLAAFAAINLLTYVVLAHGVPMTGEGVQIAAAAHVGGFAVGVILAVPLLLFRYRKA